MANEKLLPVYLVVGKEEVKRKKEIDSLKKHVDSEMTAFDLDEIYYSAETQGFDIVSSCQTFPFGSGRRVVIFWGEAKIRKDVADAICEYLKDPNPNSILAIVVPSMDKRSRLYKAIAAIDQDAIRMCDPLRKADLPDFVIGVVQDNNKSIDYFSAQEIVVRVGENESLLKREVETLCVLTGKKRVIDIEDVKSNIQWTADIKPWDIANAICERNVGRVLELFSRIDKPEEQYMGLLYWIKGSFREMICAKSLNGAYGSSLAYELTQVYGQLTKNGKRRPYKQDWQLKKVSRYASNFTMDELVDGLRKCVECEKGIKGAADNKIVCFTRFLISITTSTNQAH